MSGLNVYANTLLQLKRFRGKSPNAYVPYQSAERLAALSLESLELQILEIDLIPYYTMFQWYLWLCQQNSISV